MKKNLCIECHKRPIYIKKRQLCSLCYGKLQRKKGKILDPEIHKFCKITNMKHEIAREVEFIKNYFTHNHYIHQPAAFRLNGISYSPDFLDLKRNVWIEVAGTQQAYSSNKDKYTLFRQLFPNLNFEIRTPTGEILDETMSINSQLNPQEVP